MPQKYLTTSKKEKLLPIIEARDGSNCFYCKEKFALDHKPFRRTFDHLDNNHFNNDPSNLVLAHFRCNQDKKNNISFINMAKQKLKENRALIFDSLDMSECESKPRIHNEASQQIDINIAMKEITLDYLNDRLINQNKEALELNDTAHSISYIMFLKTKHGSSTTAKRHIGDFCSSAAPFKLVDIEGTTYIKKRE